MSVTSVAEFSFDGVEFLDCKLMFVVEFSLGFEYMPSRTGVINSQ